jgi:Transglycosylase SLT domain
LLDTPQRRGATRRPGADLGNPPSAEYRTSPARTYGGFWDDDDADDDRRGSRRDDRSRAKASPRGARRGRGHQTGRTPKKGRTPKTARAQAAQPTQRRSQRRRRRNVVVPVAVVAVFAVAAASVTAYVRGHHHSTGGNAAFEAIQHSNTLPLLAAERQQLVDMNAATHVLAMATTGKPLMVSPSQVQSSASGSSSTGGGTVVWPTPDPAAAQATAKAMLPSYGWSVSSQWSCLLSLWNRESGWVYDAQNTASGAYGIPQALPASKMASAGSDYLTNPTTQIKWGLGYIQGRYGTPCGAWNSELANGFY